MDAGYGALEVERAFESITTRVMYDGYAQGGWNAVEDAAGTAIHYLDPGSWW